MSINPIARQGIQNLFEREDGESNAISMEKDLSFSNLLKSESPLKPSPSVTLKNEGPEKGEVHKAQESKTRKLKQDGPKSKTSPKEEVKVKREQNTRPVTFTKAEVITEGKLTSTEIELKDADHLILASKKENAPETSFDDLTLEPDNLETPFLLKPELSELSKRDSLESKTSSVDALAPHTMEESSILLETEYVKEWPVTPNRIRDPRFLETSLNPWRTNQSDSLLAFKVLEPAYNTSLLKTPVPLDLQFEAEAGEFKDSGIHTLSNRKYNLSKDSSTLVAPLLSSKSTEALTIEKLDVQGFETALHGHTETVKTSETVAQIQVVQQILEDFRAQVSKRTPQFRIPLTHEMFGDLEVRITFREGENVEAQFHVTSDVLKNLIAQNQKQIRNIFKEANLACPPENLKIMKTEEFNT